MRHRILLAPAAAAVTALAACSVTPDQEAALGARDAEQVNAQLPLVRDPVVTQYVQQLGRRIASHTSRADLRWHFYVVNASEANAFALPGGYVYVNRGLIDLTSNESELAGAVAHEIGHVIERHAVKQMAARQQANIGVAALCVLTSVCENTVARTAIQIGGAAVFARNSRHDEAQADSEAVYNTLRAGIDPRGVPALFEKLVSERKYRPTVVDGWFSDHPLEESRIRASERLIAGMDPGALSGLETDSPAYHAMKDALAAVPRPPAARARPAHADSAPAPPAGVVTDTVTDTIYVP